MKGTKCDRCGEFKKGCCELTAFDPETEEQIEFFGDVCLDCIKDLKKWMNDPPSLKKTRGEKS